VFDVFNGAIEENLVGLQGVFGDGRFVFLVAKRPIAIARGHEEREQGRGYDYDFVASLHQGPY
jgi:hypothetical protein